MKGIFIDVYDVMTINGYAIAQGQRQMATMRAIIGKRKITVDEYCDYEGITKEQFYEGIGKKPPGHSNQ